MRNWYTGLRALDRVLRRDASVPFNVQLYVMKAWSAEYTDAFEKVLTRQQVVFFHSDYVDRTAAHIR
ncbi:hypothetical protein RB195_021149 [Necator americanus]|uniref:Uncharacterized protein n=1 Tax=Necator americanus TaxID=51031 RepID=A0ABR1ECA1_NECAM